MVNGEREVRAFWCSTSASPRRVCDAGGRRYFLGGRRYNGRRGAGRYTRCAGPSLVLWALVLPLTSCVGPPLEILPVTLPNGVEDTTYSEDLSVDQQGVVHWEVVDGALPAGLALGNESGVISGRPTAAGTFSFTVSAAGESVPRRSGEQTYTLVVLERLTVSFSLPDARVGEVYAATPTIAGGVSPYAVTVVGLPAGMDYDGATGTISGTPLNDAAALRLDVTVKDAGDPQQVATARVYLEIHPVGVTITATTLENAPAGVAYSVTIEAAEGREPYEWAVAAGVLPDGLRLNTTSGTISGTPEGDAETETFTIKVTDSDSPAATDTQEFKLVVPPVIGTTTLANATIGVEYDETLIAGHGLPPYSWAFSSGELPEGLQLDAGSGTISGTPVVGATSQTFTVRVTDSDVPAQTAERELTIQVGP